MKNRGKLLTETFRRMNDMGITEAEDIIAQLAQELEEIKSMAVIHEETPAVGIALPEMSEDMKNRIYIIEIGLDGSMSIYFRNTAEEVSPLSSEDE